MAGEKLYVAEINMNYFESNGFIQSISTHCV